MKLLINYLPFVYVAIAIILTELLHHRKVSNKTVNNYGKGSIHRDNNPELYTEQYSIYAIKSIRSMKYGFILIFLSAILLLVVIFTGYETLCEYGQNTLFVILSLLATVIYGTFKIMESRKAKLRLLSLYTLICVGLYVFRLGNSNESLNTDSQITVHAPTITDTVITTKSGSKWTPTSKENVYYHVVKHGESLEYIFNDITISLIKAQEQHFNILKKIETNKLEIVPIKNYETELQKHTFLYSGLNPGDTVFMFKHELERFRIEKGF